MNATLVEYYKRHYPTGTVVELVEMDDPRPVEPGTRGKVDHVDDAGQIHVNWENGRTLAMLPGTDTWKKIREPLITKDEWVPVLIAAPILIPMGMFILIKLIEAL